MPIRVESRSVNMPKDQRPSPSVPLQVLVVDPDDLTRQQVADFMAGQSLRITTAVDGRTAIGTLQRSGGRYGLVVTELNLPDADGFAILHAARQSRATSQVLIVTSQASLEAAILGVRVGAADYVLKPLDLDEFEHTYQRVMERSKELEMLGEFTSGTPMHTVGSRARALLSGGLSGTFEQRMADNPLDPRNRRISIIVKSHAATELEKSLRTARLK